MFTRRSDKKNKTESVPVEEKAASTVAGTVAGTVTGSVSGAVSGAVSNVAETLTDKATDAGGAAVTNTKEAVASVSSNQPRIPRGNPALPPVRSPAGARPGGLPPAGPPNATVSRGTTAPVPPQPKPSPVIPPQPSPSVEAVTPSSAQQSTSGSGSLSENSSGAGTAEPKMATAASLRSVEPTTRTTSSASENRDRSMSQSENGRLIVGRDIELKGEVKNCDLLVVEGTVEATLIDTSALEVTENGVFRGTAPVKAAEIAGLVEGDLIVEGHVYVRATGLVQGNVQFGELEIERGGRVAGSMVQFGSDVSASAAASSSGEEAATGRRARALSTRAKSKSSDD